MAGLPVTRKLDGRGKLVGKCREPHTVIATCLADFPPLEAIGYPQDSSDVAKFKG